MSDTSPTFVGSPALLRHAVALEWFTVGWLIVEAAVGIWAGVAANSLSVMAFGIDSVIELASAAELRWRLFFELYQHAAFADVAEQTVRRLAGALPLVLAAYIVASAAWRLWHRSGQTFSLAGLVVVVIAVPLMYVLAQKKCRWPMRSVAARCTPTLRSRSPACTCRSLSPSVSWPRSRPAPGGSTSPRRLRSFISSSGKAARR